MTNDSLAKNKEIVRRLYEEALNSGNPESLDPLVSDEFTNPFGRGPRAFAAVLADLRAAFPDIRYRVDELVADGDRVVVRWTWRGTHEAPFRQFAATHKQVASTGVAVHRVTNGKVGETWLLTDRLGFLDQLGVVPPGLIPSPPPRK